MCGTQLKSSDVLYTSEGNMVCTACSGKSSMLDDEKRAAGNIQKAAWSCLASALFGWLFNPMFVMNILTILGGIYAIQSMMRGNERFTKYLSSGARTQIWVCSIAGLAITGIQLVLILTAVAVVSTSRG
jgi:hypothetical protein